MMASAENAPKRSWRIETPRKARFILWVGVTAAFVGFGVSADSWAGDHIYDLRWFPIMLVGILLMLGGIIVAGYARAMGPRGLAKKRAALARQPTKAAVAATPATTPVTSPSKTVEQAPKKAVAPAPVPAPVPAPRPAPASGPTMERLELKCPQCATQFVAEGRRPFNAVCPACNFTAELS
ncbi:MAG: hypothetical protein ACYDCK_07545 [Thermoplasmatota archaeon]